MNGGHEFFSSLFGEFLVGRDCSSVLQDPNADQLDREVCSSLLQFQKQLRGHGLESPGQDLDIESCPKDPQSLRDEIFHRPANTLPHLRHQPDKDLDGEWRSPETPQHYNSYSSSTTVIVRQRADGTYEEKCITRDSSGREEVTTRVMDNTNHNKIPFYKRIFGPKNS